MKSKAFKFLSIIIISLCISILSISVGFSALSTTLSIDGGITFTPVGMIRVLSIEQKSIENANEISKSYTLDSINVLTDINGKDGYVNYNVNITNLGEIDEELTEIQEQIFSNDEMEYIIEGLEVGDVIKAKESINFSIKFRWKNDTVTETRLNAKLKFKFKEYEDIESGIYEYQSEGECKFNGKGNDVTGDCANGQSIDFINTGIQPFNSENYSKNFILKFTITDVDDARFTANKRDTIFNILYENDDTDFGKYPGVLLRIEGSKWQLQGGNGQSSNNSTKLLFEKDQLINKELKIIRYNDGNSIKLYYMIGDVGPFVLKDITNLYKTFDTPLTFGANLKIDNTTSDRHAYATVKDMSFKFFKDGVSLDYIVSGNKSGSSESNEDVEETKTFAISGPCVFNGTVENITGDNCSLYSNAKYINTGINLYDEDNYNKDFDMTFEINDYNTNLQEEAQVTIMNAFLERTGKGYGVLLRRNNNNLSFIARDGSGGEKEINFTANTISTFRVVRKNNNICYSINNGNLIFALDNSNFNLPFSVPVTFGSSIDSSGNPWRYITGTLSNMSIKLGKLDDSIICESN